MPNVSNAPIVQQGPVTQSAPLNVGLGLTAAGAINAGTMKLSQDDPIHNVIGVLLNLLMQPLKKMFPILKRHEAAVFVMLLIALAVAILLSDGDHRKAFRDGVLGVIDALGNYKADKMSGMNILKPADDPTA